MTPEPGPVWVHFGGFGWYEAMVDPRGLLLFEEQPPDVPAGTRVMTISREEGEPKPDVVETVALLLLHEQIDPKEGEQ
jgi:hypothetical protein